MQTIYCLRKLSVFPFVRKQREIETISILYLRTFKLLVTLPYIINAFYAKYITSAKYNQAPRTNERKATVTKFLPLVSFLLLLKLSYRFRKHR